MSCNPNLKNHRGFSKGNAEQPRQQPTCCSTNKLKCTILETTPKHKSFQLIDSPIPDQSLGHRHAQQN